MLSSSNRQTQPAPLGAMHWWTTSALVVMVLAVGFWGEDPLSEAHASDSGAADALVPSMAMPVSHTSSESVSAQSDWIPWRGPDSPLASREAARPDQGERGPGHAPLNSRVGPGSVGGHPSTPHDSADAPVGLSPSGGFEQHYHPTGELAASGRVDGERREGTWQFWYPDGSPQASRVYRAGLLDGPFRAWHSSGVVAEAGVYLGGLRHGPWERRFTDGSPMEVGTYDRGVRVGQWFFYDDRGRPVGRTGMYLEGKQIQ